MQRILKICQQSSSDVDSLEEQLVNSGAPENSDLLRFLLGTGRMPHPVGGAMGVTCSVKRGYPALTSSY